MRMIAFIILFGILASCKKDFLERAPGVNLSEEEVFSDPMLAAQYADNSYNFLIDDYFRFGEKSHKGCTGMLSDEAVTGIGEPMVVSFYTGSYFNVDEGTGISFTSEQINEIGGVWSRCYQGIRNCNVVLSKLDQVPWTTAYAPDRIKGEALFIRAFLYFELIKRFGGVPLFDKAHDVDDDIDIPRAAYSDCVNFILSDLEQAAQLLPAAYDQPTGPNSTANYGRATSGAAKALKARTLLYAASPLHNPGNDAGPWQQAAAAAKAVMDLNLYTLQPTYADILNVAQSPEYIMIKVRGPRPNSDNFLGDCVISPGSGGGQGTMDPVQNHVDLYEMQATGKPITDPASGYDPQEPYTGRDPRFYANILYNDAPWQGRRMQMWNGGADYREGNYTYSITRYYCRKYWPEVYKSGSSQTALVNFIFFRYAEVLLNYAEAQNEAAGADASVYVAVNQVRRRAGMPDLPAGLTKEQMRERIRNERAVELAFEDHRWYDIMRWKTGPQVMTRTMEGMNVVKNADGTFTYQVIALPSGSQRVYQDHMSLYPIPRSEVQKSKGILTQNPGW